MLALRRKTFARARLDDQRPYSPVCSWKREWLWYQ